MKFRIVLVLIVLAGFIFSCSEDNPSSPAKYDCTGITPTYESEIKFIINSNCTTYGCHNSSTKANGIDLSTYELVKNESKNSRFLGAIQHVTGYEAMPQGQPKLSETNIKQVSCWVQNGTPEK